MNMRYPSHKMYATLYARYLQRDPKELLSVCGDLNDKSVMDICGGGGRASIAAQEMGASKITLIDQESDMIDPALRERGIRVMPTDVNTVFWAMREREAASFDVAICQQAITYWASAEAFEQLAYLLKPGGIFVFNTFRNKPPMFPSVIQYEYQGLHYVEVRWMVADLVHHVQVCNGLPSHTTTFQWIRPEEFQQMLEPHFSEVKENVMDKTSIWTCIR